MACIRKRRNRRAADYRTRRVADFLLVGVVACFGAPLESAWADEPSTQDAAAQTNSVKDSAPEQAKDAPAPATVSPCTDPAADHPTLSKGVATVHICLDAKGNLTRDPEIESSSGSCELDQRAIQLAKSASGRYEPVTSKGKPVAGCKSFKISFKLTDGDSPPPPGSSTQPQREERK